MSILDVRSSLYSNVGLAGTSLSMVEVSDRRLNNLFWLRFLTFSTSHSNFSRAVAYTLRGLACLSVFGICFSLILVSGHAQTKFASSD